MSKVAVGSKIPKFTLPGVSAPSWSTTDAAGQTLVLYFYPKDMTSGCTLESQNFRDLHADFRRAKTLVVGISRDDTDSHRKFRQKERLPFELLADEEDIRADPNSNSHAGLADPNPQSRGDYLDTSSRTACLRLGRRE